MTRVAIRGKVPGDQVSGGQVSRGLMSGGPGIKGPGVKCRTTRGTGLNPIILFSTSLIEYTVSILVELMKIKD